MKKIGTNLIDLIELVMLAAVGRMKVIVNTGVKPVKVEPVKAVKVEPVKVAEPVKTEEGASPFTDAEIGFVVGRMGKDMTARLTPHGNIVLQHKKSAKTLFSFYKRENGYLIRRRLGYDNPYGSGNVLNGGKTFDTLNDAMNYFEEYCEKHPNSLV